MASTTVKLTRNTTHFVCSSDIRGGWCLLYALLRRSRFSATLMGTSRDITNQKSPRAPNRQPSELCQAYPPPPPAELIFYTHGVLYTAVSYYNVDFPQADSTSKSPESTAVHYCCPLFVHGCLDEICIPGILIHTDQ